MLKEYISLEFDAFGVETEFVKILCCVHVCVCTLINIPHFITKAPNMQHELTVKPKRNLAPQMPSRLNGITCNSNVPLLTHGKYPQI